ncbi:MAG: mandelate racemase/muconate lactonizing enzyme family protein [Spirochaetaceae bacterium]
MKNHETISRMEIYRADLPLVEPFRTSLAEIDMAHNIFVRIHSTGGLYGTGEARPNPVVTGETQDITFDAAATLARTIAGAPVHALDEISSMMERRLKKNSSAKSAIDIALYDLLGKQTGLPLYALLGGMRRPISTDNTVSIDDPETMAQKALRIKEMGFRAIKVKLGGAKDADVERIRRIRQAVGYEIELRLDANQGWDYKTAVAVLRDLEPYRIRYCEQPVAYWDTAHMGELRAASSIPIMADEALFSPHEAYRLAADGSCDYFNIKLSKAGGITGGLKITTIGEAAGIPCMIGCMTETRLAMSAGAHLMTARPNILFADLDGHTSMKSDPVLGGVQYNGGEMELPEAPGLGAEIDPAFLSECEVQVIE